MKRTLSVCALVALVAAGARGQGAPALQVNPLWPQPLPNHWVFGSITGVAVDAQDHVWVVHRGGDSLENNEKGMMLTPPTSSQVLHGRAVRPRVRRRRQAARELRRPGPGLSVAAIARRHRGRCEGQRVDRRGRPRRAAARRTRTRGGRSRRGRSCRRHTRRGCAWRRCVWCSGRRSRRRPGRCSTRRGRGTRTWSRRAGRSHRRARAEVRARRQVPPADRHAGQDGRARQPDDAQSSGGRCSRRGGERGIRRRHRQPPRSSFSTRRPAPTSGTGARTARSRPRPAAARTIRARRPRGSSATSPASRSRRTAWSTSATARATASRCSRRTASS